MLLLLLLLIPTKCNLTLRPPGGPQAPCFSFAHAPPRSPLPRAPSFSVIPQRLTRKRLPVTCVAPSFLGCFLKSMFWANQTPSGDLCNKKTACLETFIPNIFHRLSFVDALHTFSCYCMKDEIFNFYYLSRNMNIDITFMFLQSFSFSVRFKQYQIFVEVLLSILRNK